MSWGNLREKYSASVTSTESSIAEINVNNVERLSLDFTVTGQPLSSFRVCGRLHPAGGYNELYATSEDYTSPTGLLIGTSSDLTSLSGKGWLIIDTRALEVIQINCSSFGEAGVEVLAGG